MNDRDEGRLRSILSESRRERFEPGFTDRALARFLETRRESELASDVVRYCRRAIPAAIAAALLLALHNVVRTHGRAPSAVAAVLGVTRSAAATASTTGSGTMSVESFYGLGPAMPESE